ncbi:MAG: hypothetical protein WA655_05690 [Candidatus Korobacteraceae bacterium]
MSAEQLRQKAEKLEGRARLAVLWRVVLYLVVSALFARAVANVRQTLAPVVWPTASLWCIRIGFGFLGVWILYAAFDVCKAIWPGRVAPDAALNTTLQSYRRELERQHSFYRPSWRKMMPGFVGMALAMVPMLINEYKVAPQDLVNAAPAAVVLAILWAICFVVVGRRRRKLQAEIEQLRAFEREYQA